MSDLFDASESQQPELSQPESKPVFDHYAVSVVTPENNKLFYAGVKNVLNDELLAVNGYIGHYELKGCWPDEFPNNVNHYILLGPNQARPLTEQLIFWKQYREFLHWKLRQLDKEMLDAGYLGVKRPVRTVKA